ncbi:hypothetical protein TNCV_300891 [Trichonephila clavipes]|nr:hypothetical protein TNCV_300891 [Trichonephila clavipes]
MVLKANDRRTSCPCHDEFRGPQSDYVRQLRPLYRDSTRIFEIYNLEVGLYPYILRQQKEQEKQQDHTNKRKKHRSSRVRRTSQLGERRSDEAPQTDKDPPTKCGNYAWQEKNRRGKRKRGYATT